MKPTTPPLPTRPPTNPALADPAMAIDDELVRHLTETSDLSPLQAAELVKRNGRDRRKLDELARTFKAEG
ncbi:hypothetical protein EDC40_101248 [Aminobacter aminovorans]|uniref:DUF3606 domain-containing protein n=1 Tax=Aminobacter aminovorans TaxID=83263 RepID=A0A380WR10_AMIAI|nr:hypothetical protein EDC40_101248 [Aminobacter aminovorans]SUU90782.1 Uncharacterised protein [Aminobacter aminovorans]